MSYYKKVNNDKNMLFTPYVSNGRYHLKKDHLNISILRLKMVHFLYFPWAWPSWIFGGHPRMPNCQKGTRIILRFFVKIFE